MQSLSNLDIVRFDEIPSSFASPRLRDKIETIHKSNKSKCITEREVQNERVEVYVQTLRESITVAQIVLPKCFDPKKLLFSPVQQQTQLQFTVIKNTDGMNYFYPRYDFHLSQSMEYVCSCKKMSFQTSSYYLFSLKRDQFVRKASTSLAKLKKQAPKLYYLYDTGNNPEKKFDDIRQELGLILFGPTNPQDPRQSFQVVIPQIYNSQPLTYRPANKADSIMHAFKSLEYREKVIHFMNKMPAFNSKKKLYQLNFSPRVTQKSKKNFLLVHQDSFNDFSIQFGKCNKGTYNLDICYPFQPIQAFAICMAQFDL